METTAGQVLLNSVLPPRYRDHNRRFTKSTLNDLLARIATESPEEYPSVVKKLADVGRIAATVGGGYSFDIHHLRQTAAGQAAGQKAKAMVADILSNQALTPDQRTSQISAAISGLVPAQEKAVYQEALDSNNPLAMQVASGSRGNPSNLLGLIGAPLAYLDNQNRVIPRPVTHSYSQGMTPAQHWAATYGSRKGIVGTKISVADSGYAAKRLLRAAHQLVVTAHDDDEDFDPESPRGLPVPTDDMDSVGALLAQDVGPYKRDTIVSKKILNHLKSIGKERILVRSPTVGGPVRGGVSAKAAGLDEFGNLPGMNSAVGSNSANAISEVISQATLGAKHGGGAVTGKGDAVGGYGAINSLLEVPKQQAGGAEHAETDGRVTDISPASVGGYNVTIGGKEHYIAQGLEPLIKVGDTVEAGDVLSSGIPNPAMVVKHKGIGEGRRYFTKAMMGALKASNVKAFRRNVEMTSRGLIDHVRMNSEWGGYFPEDVVPYRTIEANWVPRKGSKTAAPESVVGQYLEKPVLHFSVGTKIRPSVIKDLKEFNVKHVTAHSEAPPFEPEMIRAMDNLSYDPDWMVRAYGSGVQKSFMDAVHRGMSSDTNSVSFVPALAKRVDFAQGRQVAPGIKPVAGPEGEMVAPKIAYTGQYANNNYTEAAGQDSAAGALNTLDPEAMATLTGTRFNHPLPPMNQQPGLAGPVAPSAPVAPTSPSFMSRATNFLSTPTGAITAGIGTAAAGYGASKAFRPSVAAMAPGVGKTVAPSAYEAAAKPAAGAVSAAKPVASAAQPILQTAADAAKPAGGLWSKAKMVGGKVIAPLGLAADAYGVGSNYYQGYQNNGMQGAYDAGHDAAMHRFDNLNSSNPLQVAGGVANLVYNAPQNVNLIAHGAIDTGRAAAETTKAVGNTYQTSKMTGTYNPMEAKRYHTPGQLLEEWKKSPYAPVEAATEQLYNIPAAAGAMANQAQVAQSEATRNRQLVTEINQKRVAQGLPPISDVPEWTGNRMADQAIESVTNRPTAVGSGFRQLMGGSGNAVNPVTGAPIRSIWSYFGK